jgi:small subunit ribosomal protein S9
MAEPTKKPTISTKKDYTYAVGRRKTASARVRVYQKSGDNLVNGMPFGLYFPGSLAVLKLTKPFKLIDKEGKFSFSAKVAGSGKSSQLDAVVHGISRALSTINPEDFRSPLKKAGLLTRDSRMKESRKVGTGGKARRKKQSPKR